MRSHLSSMAILWQTIDTDNIRSILVGGFFSVGRLYSEGDLGIGGIDSVVQGQGVFSIYPQLNNLMMG
jgi:hypothetical protein